MRKPDEKRLWAALWAGTGAANTQPVPCVRDIVQNLGINHKRAWYLLGKWADRGWYDYGVTIDTGWLTEKGLRRPE